MEGSIKNNFQEPVHYIAVRPKLLSKLKAQCHSRTAPVLLHSRGVTELAGLSANSLQVWDSLISWILTLYSCQQQSVSPFGHARCVQPQIRSTVQCHLVQSSNSCSRSVNFNDRHGYQKLLSVDHCLKDLMFS